MRTVVLDASVLIAGLMKDGRAREVLVHAPEIVFVVPPGIVREVERQLTRIARRAGVTTTEARTVMRILLERVQEVSLDALRPFEGRAKSLAREAGDVSNWEYVALAIALDAPIWAYDDDFRRMQGVKVVGTAALSRPPE